jgi:hypothetical protein
MKTFSNSNNILGSFNQVIPVGLENNSVHDYFDRGVGAIKSNIITLNANNTTESINIFKIIESVKIERLYAKVLDNTTLVNCTSASFDLFDGTNIIQITAPTGILSGVSIDSFIFKEGLYGDAFSINDAIVGAVQEQTYEGSNVFNAFILTAKYGADTYLRFTYTTTDAPINAQLKIFVEYSPLEYGIIESI